MSTSENASRALKSTSARRKDALIAAFATVLAAVILASGGVIAAGRRDRAELREEISILQATLSSKTKQISVLEQKLRVAGSLVLDAGATVVPSTSTPDGVPPPVARTLIGRQQEQGFDIGFYGCYRAAGAVRCQFDVTNTKAERYFRVLADTDQRDSRGYDDQGQQLLATSAEIPGADHAGLTIPDGVTVNASVTFTTVPASTTTFVVLKFVFTYEYNRYSVEFRNVNLSG